MKKGRIIAFVVLSAILFVWIFPIRAAALANPLLSVAVSPSTPASWIFSPGTSDVLFTRIQFATARENIEDIKVTAITVTNFGTAADTDLQNIRLLVGQNQIGFAVSVFNNGKAIFSSLDWAIPPGYTMTLSVEADLSINVVSGKTVILGIESFADISSIGVASGETTVTNGDFPLIGNIMNISEQPFVVIVYPDGGEVLEKGRTYTIRWLSVNVNMVTVYLVRGSIVWEITSNNTSAVNSFTWTVPSTIPPANDYKIWIIAYQINVGSAQDWSDNYFSVVPPALRYKTYLPFLLNRCCNGW